MTRDDPRRQQRDLYRAIAKARAARGDHAGAAMARWQAKQMGESVRTLGEFGRVVRRSEATGRWRRGA